jgi:hypothetical protein
MTTLQFLQTSSMRTPPTKQSSPMYLRTGRLRQDILIVPPEGGGIMQEADVDGDGEPELVVATAVPGRGRLIVFYRDQDDRYQPSEPDNLQRHEAMRIWQVEDINQDGINEILFLTHHCGAHTCFPGIGIVQWQNRIFTELLEIELSYADIRLEDRDSNGIKEIVLEGGNVGSVGAGEQRVHTEVYEWNGATYQLTRWFYDPVASRDPYWRLVDGNFAVNMQDFQQAIQLYQDGLQTAADREEYTDSELGRVIVATLYFQLMFAYIQIGDVNQASAVYANIQQQGDYSEWARSFWQIYEQSRDITASCDAAKQAAKDVDLPGYSYVAHSLGAGDALCFMLDGQALPERP